VADVLLAYVETVTIAHEIASLRLETGVRQIAALRFYERAGFVRTTPFGAYITMSPEATATSIFMEKRLG
jgi:ribosomal protein S18 acetylase RimI-like enzyme